MLKWPLIWLVQAYRYGISPLLGPRCRFTPTCSEYAIQALQTHGTIRGSFLAVKRIFRCHPYCDGGYDPIPPLRHISQTTEKNASNSNSSQLRD